MPVYRIAEINIEITPKSHYLKNQLADLLTNAKADFRVDITRADLENELAIYRRTTQSNSDISFGICESLAVYRKICRKIITDYNGILMHGAVIGYKGKAYLFTAPSGTGKTTHIRLWKQYFGDEVTIISGDKPILRQIDGKIVVYGTSWNGKENYGENTSAELDGIFILKRNPVNSVRKCEIKTALPFLFSQTLRYEDEKSVVNLLNFMENLVKKVRIFILECNMELSAVETSLSAIQNYTS